MVDEHFNERGVGGQAGSAAGAQAGGAAGAAVGGYFGGPVGAAIGQKVGEKYGSEIGEKVGEQAEDTAKSLADQTQDQTTKKKSGGGCSGGSSSSSSSSDSANCANSPESLGDVNIEDVDDSVNKMCKKTFTVYRPIPIPGGCPTSHRDNLADQFTPLNDLMAMEKTVKDFLKLESKIYDAESTNPRFFASEDWVYHYEKDKNVLLAALDQYRANTIRMQNLYAVVDDKSYSTISTIPNQDCKSQFQTFILWASRELKDWINHWFISKCNCHITKLWCKDHWTPGLTGEMISWMKLGTFIDPQPIMTPTGIETMIKKVDKLEALIDRLDSKDTVNRVISQFVNLKETLEQQADQTKDKVFTSKVIDATMGKKLGVSDTGVKNDKIEGTTYIPPKEDKVEQVNLVCKLSAVKSLFQTIRCLSNAALKTPRCTCPSKPKAFPLIWTTIDLLAEKVYGDLAHLNCLIEDQKVDSETPGKHCSVNHTRICPKQMRLRITAFRCVIEKGVIDVMLNQAALPKIGLNKLDSMFNQLWEIGEQGPNVSMPSWCQEAIDSINKFEDSLLDAWDEVYDCWEREFIVRLWRICVEHHTSNWRRIQTNTNTTSHDHIHDQGGYHGSPTGPSSAGDSSFKDTSFVHGYLSCPGHLPDLLKPVCVCYRVDDIEPLARSWRADVKELCQWMTAAIQAIGIKQATISAVMSDPSLNGSCANLPELIEINELRSKNSDLLKKAEKAYGIYSDVNNMKNKKEYDEEIALAELQPNKYSNEDQLNMSSSVQSETNESDLSSELCQGGIMCALKPWKHMTLSENHVEPKCIPVKCVCNKFEKVVSTDFDPLLGSA